MFTENAYATILLCSYLGVKEGNYKPFTAIQWSEFAYTILNSNIKEPGKLLNMSRQDIMEGLSISQSESERVYSLLSRGANIAFVIEELDRKGINIVTRSDAKYPSKLKSLLKKNAPPLFYYSGDISIVNKKGIAIVGSRNIDDAAQNFAKKLAEKAASEGLVIFSGGARGIDTISEQAALDNGGLAVSVLTDSMLQKIKKKEVRDKITNNQLLLITASNPDAAFNAGNAMNRNKYVYTLSSGAFIIASDYNKGGTWAGATENIRNDWVSSYVWNTASYKGNSELIKKGAQPIDSLLNMSVSELINLPKDKSAIQLDLFVYNNNSRELDVSGISEEKSEDRGIETKDEDVNYDVFFVIVDVLTKLLEKPRTLQEIICFLNINKSQANSWLDRAIELEKVEKLIKPVRYVTKG